MSDSDVARVLAHYATVDEGGCLREGRGRVEYIRTQRLVRAALAPAPRRVLDVGGADGIHALWLSANGHEVELLDVVAAHVEAARARGLGAVVGDARSLPHADATFDAVLLLGPLYHLATRDERMKALREANRVLRPRGLLAAAAISRLAVAMDWLAAGSLGEGARRQVAERIVAVGRDDTGAGAGAFYFHTPEQLAEELASAGLCNIVVHGVEGPGWLSLPPGSGADAQRGDDVIHLAELADAESGAIAASMHLLAFGHRRWHGSRSMQVQRLALCTIRCGASGGRAAAPQATSPPGPVAGPGGGA